MRLRDRRAAAIARWCGGKLMPDDGTITVRRPDSSLRQAMPDPL